jgi:signal transduction histidine kinase
VVLTHTRTNLVGVLEKIVRIFAPDAERRMIKLELVPSEHPIDLQAGDEVLTELFQNLIVNALEATPDSSRVLIRADIMSESVPPAILVRVEDEGPGIAPEVLKQIFKPFFTTKQKGTGLGLSVAQRRAMELGGTIACVSPISSAGGTRFEVQLPL